MDITEWYNLTLSNAEQIKFYKNGRIDVRFKDSQAAENCYRRLRLDENHTQRRVIHEILIQTPRKTSLRGVFVSNH